MLPPLLMSVEAAWALLCLLPHGLARCHTQGCAAPPLLYPLPRSAAVPACQQVCMGGSIRSQVCDRVYPGRTLVCRYLVGEGMDPAFVLILFGDARFSSSSPGFGSAPVRWFRHMLPAYGHTLETCKFRTSITCSACLRPHPACSPAGFIL